MTTPVALLAAWADVPRMAPIPCQGNPLLRADDGVGDLSFTARAIECRAFELVLLEGTLVTRFGFTVIQLESAVSRYLCSEVKDFITKGSWCRVQGMALRRG